MSFQKCPICEGSGKVSFLNHQCKVCAGAGIISEINGLPPATEPPKPTTDDLFCQQFGRYVLKKRAEDPHILLDDIVKDWKHEQ